MTTRWDAYPEASLADFERRCSRPGARNYAAMEALDNYQRELESNRERERYFQRLDSQTMNARVLITKTEEE